MTHSFLSASLNALLLLCVGIEPNAGPLQGMLFDSLLYVEMAPCIPHAFALHKENCAFAYDI